MSDCPFAVVVPPESLVPGRYASVPATGDLWVVLGREPFPVAGWSDFVVVIVTALVSATHRLASGASKTEIVHFMEGPYELDLEACGTDSVRVSAVERGRGARLGVEAPERDILAAVLESATSVLDACRSRGCWSADADRLHAARANLAILAEGRSGASPSA